MLGEETILRTEIAPLRVPKDNHEAVSWDRKAVIRGRWKQPGSKV